MAFSLTKVQCYGIEAEEPVNKRYGQRMILNITAANTDIDLDLGDYSGTFWTATGASAVGSVALKAIKQIQTLAASLNTIGGDAIRGRFQVATATNAGEYSVAMDTTNTHLPNILFDSGDAPTSYVVVLDWVLLEAQEPIEVDAAA